MSYDSIVGHRSMAMDEIRNAAYDQALQKVIHPDSVVLDLGAGLGTLGLLAAKLGARRVYLVEPSEVVSLTRQLVKQNGMEQRVQVLHGRIEEIELPEQVDVITSVMTGNFLLSEDLLPTLFLARDRHLKPTGHLIPSAAVMEVQPVSLPAFYEKHVTSWSKPHLGLDFSGGRESAVNDLYWGSTEFKDAAPLGPATDLHAVDLMTASSTHCAASTESVIESTGTLHGWLGWFRMQLGDAWLSTSPFAPPVHWSAAFLPLPEPISVAAGERVGFTLQRPPAGDWTWTTKVGGRTMRQSTFLGAALTLATLAKLAGDARPTLSANGSAIQAVLAAMKGTHTLDELAALLQAQDPKRYTTLDAALAQVHELARAYT